MAGYLPKPCCPILNKEHPLVKGRNLVLAMPFSEGSIESKAYDLSGYENHGVWYGNPIIGNSPYGYAPKLDGDGDYLQIDDVPSLDPTTEFTLHCLLNPNYTYGSGHRVTAKWGTNGYRTWLLHLDTDGTFWFAVSSDGTKYYVEDGAPFAFTENALQHLCITYKGGDGIYIYVDGIKLSTTNWGNESLPASLYNSITPVQIGRNYNDSPAGYWYKGYIAGFNLWNEKLNHQEITQLYHDPFCIYKDLSITRTKLFTQLVGEAIMAGIEDYFVEVGNSPKIPIHAFKAVLEEVMIGEKTAAEGKTAIETLLGESLSSEAATDWTDINTYIAGGSGYAGKKERLSRICAPIVLGENNIWYGTRSALGTRIEAEIT